MSSVFISNVDDYLAPSQACVNPLFSESFNNKNDKAPDETAGLVVAVTRKQVLRRSKRPLIDAAIPKAPTETAKVSMADCLACSGCVTTAETVLVEQHSLKTLHELLANNNRKVCMTLSPASLADFFRHLQVTTNQTNMLKRQLATFLATTCQASLVVDGQVPLSWSLMEASLEFVHVYRINQARGTMDYDRHSPPKPSIAISALKSQVLGDIHGQSQITITHKTGRDDGSCQLPLISATCPALVCLVEKSHARAVSHLASTKSPMSMAGAYYKHILQDSTILHIAIMPCHDKKLEASRKDLAWGDTLLIPDVDLVLTTTELVQLLEQTCRTSSVDDMRLYLEGLAPAPTITSLLEYTSSRTDVALVATLPNGHFQSKLSSTNNEFYAYTSGGYADYIFQFACRELFGYSIPGGNVPWLPVASTQRQSARAANRKKEYHQVTLYHHADGSYSCEKINNSSKKVLSFCTAYGLQTLQRILLPFDKDTIDFPFDYIEAMACPSGCLNGGGQVRLSDREDPSETRQRVALSQEIMETSRVVDASNTDIYNETITPFGHDAQTLLHTRYHVVPQLQFSTGATAGVAVQDTHW